MKGIKTVCAGALAALALAGAASAQTPPSDAERAALAQQICTLIGAQTLSATRQAVRGMISSTVRTSGNDPARAQAANVAMADALDRMMPRVLQGAVQLMAQDFTAEELRGILGFYRSPTGQALLQKLPDVSRQSIRLSLGLMPQMMRDFQTEYCAKVVCGEQDRQSFAATLSRLDQAVAQPPAPAAGAH